MYCIRCGAELSAGQTLCPLCNTRVYHPDIPNEKIPTYPKKEFVSEQVNRKSILFVLTILFLIPLVLPLVFELSYHSEVSWSGYVAGGVVLFYLFFILPSWFKHPLPTVFVPCDFAAILLFLLYVDLQTDGGWFLPFALPVAGVLGLIVTALATLLFHLRHGYLYVWGGGLIALGAWTVLIEMMIGVAFDVVSVVRWSLFSLIPLFILGMLLIVVAIVRPFRESLYKIFFIGKG
ncbi:MAG: hypothetical protein IJ009_02920 [Clostridia bacterium]|nr:hypothetical protein [Clostridia bacterium]